MMAIFLDMVEDNVEVFMDDFLIVCDSYNNFLVHLANVLRRYEECNLVLNWENYYFMVKEEIVFSHKISKKGIGVDKPKIEAIEKLLPPIFVKGIHSFLRHAGSYRRFIKDFSKISNVLFDESYLKVFKCLK